MSKPDTTGLQNMRAPAPRNSIQYRPIIPYQRARYFAAAPSFYAPLDVYVGHRRDSRRPIAPYLPDPPPGDPMTRPNGANLIMSALEIGRYPPPQEFLSIFVCCLLYAPRAPVGGLP